MSNPFSFLYFLYLFNVSFLSTSKAGHEVVELFCLIHPGFTPSNCCWEKVAAPSQSRIVYVPSSSLSGRRACCKNIFSCYKNQNGNRDPLQRVHEYLSLNSRSIFSLFLNSILYRTVSLPSLVAFVSHHHQHVNFLHFHFHFYPGFMTRTSGCHAS